MKKHVFKRKKEIEEKKDQKSIIKPKEKDSTRVEEKHFLPNIPRFITEEKTMHVALLVLLFFVLCLFTMQLVQTEHQVQSQKMAKTKLEANLTTWEKITRQYPTYRDAYFEAAVLAYRLGDTQTEEANLEKLQEIDPNFHLALELENNK